MTLTEASTLAKKVMLFTGIFSVLVIIIWISVILWLRFAYKPPVIVETPTVLYGALPKLTLKKQAADSSSLNFSIDTKTGSVDGIYPELFKVYSIARIGTDLLALDRAKKLAESFGFQKNQQAISPTQYRFLAAGGGDLTIDLDTGNFKFRRPIATQSADLDSREDFLDSQKTGRNFTSYLSSKGLLYEPLQKGRVVVQYDNSSASTVQKAFVNLWQEDVDKTPIVTDKFSEGLIRGMITNINEEKKRYVLLDYTYWPIDLKNFSTYPIITASQAYEKLQKGESLVPVYFTPKNTEVSITDVYLAYFLPEDYTQYLQPVYVFTGPDFTAYVQAISSEYIEQ